MERLRETSRTLRTWTSAALQFLLIVTSARQSAYFGGGTNSFGRAEPGPKR